MQPYTDLSFADLFDHHSVRREYIQPIKTLLEVNALSTKWKIFREYYDGAEGIRYAFDVGFADWLVPKTNKQEQIHIPHLLLRSKLFIFLREMRLD